MKTKKLNPLIKLQDDEIAATEVTVFSHSESDIDCVIDTISLALQDLGFGVAVEGSFTKVRPIRHGAEDRVCRISVRPPLPFGKAARSAKRR